MRRRKRWVVLTAACLVAGVPQAHAQVGMPAVPWAQVAAPGQPAAMSVPAQAVSRVAQLEGIAQQVVGTVGAVHAVAGAVRPMGSVGSAALGYGSGRLMPYASRHHRTSSARGFRVAAASPRGCLIIGDSVAALTMPYLQAQARQRLGPECAQEVWNGRPTIGAVDALQRIATTHGLPPHVVMVSGSNDIFDPPAFRAQVERAARIVGPRRTLVWTSVFVRRPATGTAAADLGNSRWLTILLSRVAARHRNVQVVDWYGFLVERQRRLATYLVDGVHPTPAGRAALAELIGQRWSTATMFPGRASRGVARR